MAKLNLNEVRDYIETNIGTFHQKRIASLDKLKLRKVLQRKNPYLFRAKYLLTPGKIVESLADAHISSHEETVFGDWLEGLAKFVNAKVYGGAKSEGLGMDLNFTKEGIRYIVSVKSGPNWGNSRQVAKMIADFNTARRVLSTSNSKLHVVAVNGCCYGRHSVLMKKDNYYKFCGEKFWTFISNEPSLYVDIIQPLGTRAKERNDDFVQSYSQMITRFTIEFARDFCNKKGAIDWEKLVKFNSAEMEPPMTKP